MDYVNIHGEKVSLATLATPKISKVKMPSQATHKGFVPMGFSPDQIEDARRRHASEVKSALENGREPPKPFTVESFMRTSKPKRISKPFASAEAANQAKLIAEKSGWIGVTIVALTKGGTQ